MMPLPEWMTAPAPEPPPIGRGRRSWITKAIDRLIVLTAPAGAKKSPPVAIDPRAAFVLFVGLIVCTTFLRNPVSLALSCLVAVALALTAGASLRTLALSMLSVAALTCIAMVPAMTASMSPGRTVLHVLGIAVTAKGLRIAMIIVLRGAACLAYGIGLFSSNAPEELFAALRWFRVPGVFVAVLLVTYRYLQVIARAALDDHTARRSRVAVESDLSSARQWAGERIGALYAKSRELGEEIHLGMISRGFDGVWMPRRSGGVHIADLGWLAVCAAVSIGLLFMDKRML